MMATLLDFFFPPQCLICRGEVGAQGSLCESCWGKMRFISTPFCAICALPFDYSAGEGALCGECLQETPPYTLARAVFRYDEHSRMLVTRLKYADQSHLARSFGTWLATYGRDAVGASDVIVPVPLHYWRFVTRRYNQAALLAYALSKQCGLPVLPDGLVRTRHTRPQASLSRAQRLKNVKNAFSVHPRHAGRLQGASVLLVDDVMTTAATLKECCQTLLDHGARRVQVVTLSRTC